MKRIWVFCDGSTGAEAPEGTNEPQPGQTGSWRTFLRTGQHCAAAAVARNDRGHILDWRWQRLPPVSNNEAEYAGLILGLEMAHALGATDACCVLDSEIVAGQMSGRFAVNSAALRGWHWKACIAARRVPAVHYYVVPREWNTLTDGLARQALVPWRTLRGAIEQFNKN